MTTASDFQSTYAIAPLCEADWPALADPVESLADVIGSERMISIDPNRPDATAQIAEVLQTLTSRPPGNPLA